MASQTIVSTTDSPFIRFIRRWGMPRSEDRDVAFRERTIRLVVGIGVLLIGLTLIVSVVFFQDPWELVSYPALYTLMLVVGLGAAVAVSQGNVIFAGWLLVIDWMVAGLGFVVVEQGAYGIESNAALLLALICASAVLPRTTILPIGFICIAIAAGIAFYSDSMGVLVDPSGVGPIGQILTNAVLFLAVAMFLRERAKESDDRLEAMRLLIIEANEARQEADEANRAKSQFLANMSHELRTPLNAVTGYTDIMLNGMAGDFSEKQHELLVYIQSNGKRLLALINDVLDLSKIESGKVEVFFTLASPRKTVGEVVDSMQSLAQQKHITLQLEYGDDVPEAVLCDVPKVQQIVTNLVGNAIKFTDEGGVTVELGADGKDWQLRIRDTGIGMPANALDDIFEKFRQIDNEKTRSETGTGLGLAIVKSLIDRLDGTIRVESALGSGTTFYLSFPRYPTEAVGSMDAQSVADEQQKEAVNV